MTRASTPGSLSTMTASVWDSIASFTVAAGSWEVLVDVLTDKRPVKTSRSDTALPLPACGGEGEQRSHHHLPFLGDGILQALGGIAQNHLVVSAPRRNHRETILRRIDHTIENDRLLHLDHLGDGGIEVGGLLAADADSVIGLGELDEIRQGRGVALRITPAVQQLLPLPYHPHVLVVEDEDLDR